MVAQQLHAPIFLSFSYLHSPQPPPHCLNHPPSSDPVNSTFDAVATPNDPSLLCLGVNYNEDIHWWKGTRTYGSQWFSRTIVSTFQSMDEHNSADQAKLKPYIVLSGTANEGSAGPPIGLVDIGESENAYLFRVALPGVRKDQSKIKCQIQCDGRVYIEGVMTSVGLVRDSATVYQMKVQQLCPPGPFTICFNLPGPVDPRLFSPNFRPDGILEVVVMKYKSYSAEDLQSHL